MDADFLEGLVETCTIYTDGVSKNTTTFEEQDNRTALYSNIPCRVHLVGQSRSLQRSSGAQSGTERQRVLMVQPEYDEALPGYLVVHNGQSYIISDRQKVFGEESTPHHVVYILDKEHSEDESA